MLVPAAAALLVLVAGRRAAAASAVAVGGVAVTLAVAVSVSAAQSSARFGWGPRLALTLDVRGVARVMAVLVPAVAVAVVAYATGTPRDERGRTRLLALLVAFVGAMELLVEAGDFLTLLMGWELVGACSWALIAHDWRDPLVPRAAVQAFVTTRAGDVGLYLAAAAAFAASGSFAFGRLPHGGTALGVVAAGLLLAAAAKSAQLPFSPWLFAAMAGPTPASALLHSATMVAAGAYALTRVGPLLDPVTWFGPAVAVLGAATALAGGVVASVQPDFKRALAASTSAQYGLILVAIGSGSVAAAMAHLVTHAAFKALLFLGAGVAIHAAGSGRLARMRLGSVERTAAVLVGVGAAFLGAVPLLAGWSKEQVLAAAAAESPWLAVAVTAAGALSAFYAGRLWLLAYGPGTPRDREASARSRPVERAAMGALAAGLLVVGFAWTGPIRRLLERTTGGALPEEIPWGIVTGAVAVAAALAAVWALDHRGRLATLGLAPARQEALADWLGLPAIGRIAVVDPVLALSRALAKFDDRVVDAGVRGAAAVAASLSRLLAWWGERGVDGVVVGVAGATLALARGSRITDESGIDAVVEDVAVGVGVAGRHSRRLQTGLAHQYYVIAAVGALAVIAAAWIGRT